jgi:hypothetical protein
MDAEYALVEAGEVKAVIVADAAFIASTAAAAAAAYGHAGGAWVDTEAAAGAVTPGWTYDGTDFAPPAAE